LLENKWAAREDFLMGQAIFWYSSGRDIRYIPTECRSSRVEPFCGKQGHKMGLGGSESIWATYCSSSGKLLEPAAACWKLPQQHHNVFEHNYHSFIMKRAHFGENSVSN
jgi:hypothetical protein